MDSSRRDSGDGDLAALLSGVFLFLNIASVAPSAQQVFRLEQTLLSGVQIRTVTALHTLCRDNEALLQALLVASCACPNALSPASSFRGLSLRALDPETAWEDVASRLGGAFTHTSCLRSSDDLADSFNKIITCHYEGTIGEQDVVWTLDENVLFLKLVREHLPAVHSSSSSPVPLLSLLTQWTSVSYAFRRRCARVALPAPYSRKYEWLGPLSCFMQWTCLLRAMFPMEKPLVPHCPESVKIVQFSFALIEFGGGGDSEEGSDSSSRSSRNGNIASLVRAATHASHGLRGFLASTAPDLLSAHGATQLDASLPLHCATLHFWQQETPLAAEGAGGHSVTELQKYSMTRAMVSLLKATALEKADDLCTYSFWDNLAKVAGCFAQAPELFAGDFPLVDARSISLKDEPQAPAVLTPVQCFLWFRDQFRSSGRLWEIVEEHSLLQFMYDIVLHCRASAASSAIKPPVYALATQASGLLQKHLPGLVQSLGADEQAVAGAQVAEARPILCGLFFHIKRGLTVERRVREGGGYSLWSRHMVVTLLEQKICHHLFVVDCGMEGDRQSRAEGQQPQDGVAVEEADAALRVWTAVSAALHRTEGAMEQLGPAKSAHARVSAGDCFRKWVSLLDDEACDLSQIPPAMRRLFYFSLSRIRQQSAAIFESDMPSRKVDTGCESTTGEEAGGECVGVVGRVRVLLRRVMDELMAKLLHLASQEDSSGEHLSPMEDDMSLVSLLRRTWRGHDDTAEDLLRLQCLKLLSSISECRQLEHSDVLHSLKSLYMTETFAQSSDSPAETSVSCTGVSKAGMRASFARVVFDTIDATVKSDALLNQSKSTTPPAAGRGSEQSCYRVWREILEAADEACILPWSDEDRKSLLLSVKAVFRSLPGASSQVTCMHWCRAASTSQWEEVAWLCRGSRAPVECFFMATLLYQVILCPGDVADRICLNQMVWSAEQDAKLCLLFSMMRQKRGLEAGAFPFTGRLVRELMGGELPAVACVARWFTCLCFSEPSRGCNSNQERDRGVGVEAELSGMILDFLVVRQQLHYPEVGLALLWVFFAVFFKVEDRTRHMSFQLWRYKYEKFEEAVGSGVLSFSQCEKELLRNAYLTSTSREHLWRNLLLCVEHLSNDLHAVRALSPPLPGSDSVLEAKSMNSYLLFLVTLSVNEEHLATTKHPLATGLSKKRPRAHLAACGGQDRCHGEEGNEVDKRFRNEVDKHFCGHRNTISAQSVAMSSSPPSSPSASSTLPPRILCWEDLPLSHWLVVLQSVQRASLPRSTFSSQLGANELQQAYRMMAAALKTVELWQWTASEDEIIQLCWQISSSAKSLFFLEEDCYQHFLGLVRSYAVWGDDISSDFRRQGSVLSLRLHEELLKGREREQRGEALSPVLLSTGVDEHAPSSFCAYLHFIRLKLLQGPLSAPDVKSFGGSSTTTSPPLASISCSLPLSATQWAQADVVQLRSGLEQLQIKQDMGIKEVSMWMDISCSFLGRMHSAAACHHKVMTSPQLFWQYSNWQAETDQRVALLHCMLHFVMVDDLRCAGHEDKNAIRSEGKRVSTTQRERRARVLDQLSFLPWKLHQCGVRWNFHIAFIEQRRLSAAKQWSAQEISMLSESITRNKPPSVHDAYSVLHWEAVTKIFAGMCESYLPVDGAQERTLESNAGLSAGHSSSPSQPLLNSMQSLGTATTALPPALSPTTDAPRLLAPPPAGGDACLGARSVVECFCQSQWLATTSKRRELQSLVHHIGLTKKDLILALSPEEDELFWRTLVRRAHLTILNEGECRVAWMNLVSCNDGAQLTWTDAMRQRLREIVVWLEGNVSCLSCDKERVELAAFGCVPGARASTTRGIQRQFDWDSVSAQLNQDASFTRSIREQADRAGGSEVVSSLDCFQQWHCVEYPLAVGTGHSHLGAWEPFEDELLEASCKRVLKHSRGAALPPAGWVHVSSCMEYARSPLQCRTRWKQLTSAHSSCIWSDEEEMSLIAMTGRCMARGDVDWQDVSMKLAARGSSKTALQCSNHFASVILPRLRQPSVEEQWAARNVDSFLLARGSRSISEARDGLAARGVRGCSDHFVLKHVDWVALGEVVKMTAHQTKKRFLHLHLAWTAEQQQNGAVQWPV